MQIVLIRHAHSEANAKGVLSGRISGIHLSATGISQSQELITRLGAINVCELRISPLERCAETINPWWESIGKKNNRGVEIKKDENLIEVDYGKWSGKKLAVLSAHKLWRTVQHNPSAMYFPSGEGLAQMQERAMRAVHAAIAIKKRGAAVLVSHGDVIKSIVASSLRMHLDDFQRIVIDPASVTVIDFSSSSKPRLLLLNDSRADLESFINAPYRKRNLLGGGAGK
ncbi:MAG: MSMEG_4193 family putative phosphomutase [Actinomycetales bacterium]|jgi:probable phosphoglycerate mutase|nr:MAG: MSMEG_4193 family putative phosphomutase [Actinomycetales bacterium]